MREYTASRVIFAVNRNECFELDNLNIQGGSTECDLFWMNSRGCDNKYFVMFSLIGCSVADTNVLVWPRSVNKNKELSWRFYQTSTISKWQRCEANRTKTKLWTLTEGSQTKVGSWILCKQNEKNSSRMWRDYWAQANKRFALQSSHVHMCSDRALLV